jgi:hypothetical protein
MGDRLDELGIAGWLDDDERTRLAMLHVDVDAIQSIGIAGAITPELLLQIAEIGAGKVATLLAEIGAGGAWEPEQLELLLAIEPARVRNLVHTNGWWGEDPGVLVQKLLEAD